MVLICYYTKYPNSVIPLIPILLYHLSYFGKTNYRIHKERINDICQAKSYHSLVHLCLTDVLFSAILHSLQFFVCHLHILSYMITMQSITALRGREIMLSLIYKP